MRFLSRAKCGRGRRASVQLRWVIARSPLAIALIGAPVLGATIDYTGVKGQEQYTITTTGMYTIAATGAVGGGFDASPAGISQSAINGGAGATIGGTFILTAGTVLDLYIGQQGGFGTYSGGGGGATWVALDSGGNPGTLLIAAGGGGGADTDDNGGNATFGNTGTGGGSSTTYLAEGGNPGGGGGYTGAGANGEDEGIGSAGGGAAFPTLTGGHAGTEGAVGGYGGGGGAAFEGGGGGGYSGGNDGAGGGSYIDPTATDLLQSLATPGDGSFTINSVPEPTSLGLLALGGITLLKRSRRGVTFR